MEASILHPVEIIHMSKKISLTGISSVALHSGGKNAEYSHVTPIYATSTFTFDTAQQGMERFESADKEKYLQPLEQSYFQSSRINYCSVGRIWIEG